MEGKPKRESKRETYLRGLSMKERWKDVPGYGGCYQVSNQGRVRSVDRVIVDTLGRTRRLKGQIRRLSVDSQYGYLAVHLWKDGIGQTIRVHQLVAITWIGPCPPGQQVRHKNKGYLNNSVGNLSYGTRSQDGLDKRRDGTHGGRAVRHSDGEEFINMHVAAEETGCGVGNIWAVCNGRRKSTGGYGWEYV